jgi:hypothetical protein
MGQKQLSQEARLALGVCFLMAAMTNRHAGDLWPQHDFFTKHNQEIGYKGVWTDAMRKAAQYHGQKLRDEGTVLNKTREMHPPLTTITTDEAKLAAFILKSGYTEHTRLASGRIRSEHSYFTSLGQALEKSPQLASIKLKYGLPDKQLWTAMHKADPLLQRHRIHFMRALDEEAKHKRLTRARWFLSRANKDSTFLERIYFIDECAICFDHETRKGVHVYCDAFDKGYKYVIPYKKVKPNQKIKVHILVAVNAKTGATFLEYTTGTTEISRRYNNEPGSVTQRRYKVCVGARCAHASWGT